MAAGGEDSLIRIYDLRALKELATYKKEGDYKSINSIGFSKSGSVLFASSNNSLGIHMWDVFSDGNSFDKYEHSARNEDNLKGIKQIALNYTGDTIAYVVNDQIYLIK